MGSDKIRFHLDEHIDPRIAEAIRTRGIDVTATLSANLRMASDSEQWNFAKQQARVLVTKDADFLRLALADPAHPGIVMCHRTGLSTSGIIQGLLLIHEVLTPQEMRGNIEYL